MAELRETSRRFTGKLPFPHVADWAADGALFALQALKGMLRDEEDPVGERFIAEVLGSPLASWQSQLLHPATFAFLAREPSQWTWSQLCEELALDGGALAVADTNVRIWTNPGPVFAQMLRRLGRGSRGKDCAEASFIDPSSPDFERYLTLTRDAFSLLESAAPGFATDLKTSVHAVAFVDGKASFRGSSGVIHRGLVFLSPDKSWDATVFAEELVHETTHNVLDLLSLREPLLVGSAAFEEKYSAPFRPDPRHLYGNFHALVVVARLLWLFSAFEKCGIGNQSHWQQRRSDYAARASSSLSDVRQYGNKSATAQTLIEELVVPTLTELGSRG